MEREAVNLYEKRIKQSLSRIGAKIADATDLSQKSKQLSANSEALLINALRDLEELYVSLNDQLMGDVSPQSRGTDCTSTACRPSR